MTLIAAAAVVLALVIVLPITLSGHSSPSAPSGPGGSPSNGHTSISEPIPTGSSPATDGGDTSGDQTGAIQPPSGASGQTHLDQLLSIFTDTTGATGAVNTLWSQEYPVLTNGKQWVPAPIKFYSNGQPACTDSAQEALNNSFYCPQDNHLWLNPGWLAQMDRTYGDYAPVIILMHEEGHYVAYNSGFNGARSIQREEEADCIAGYETQYAAKAGLLQLQDVEQGMSTLYGLGDTSGETWFDSGVHGDPQQREAAFLQGFSGNMDNCIAISRQAFGPKAQIGDFDVDFTQGIQTTNPVQGTIEVTNLPNSHATVDLTSYADGDVPGGTGDAGQDASAVLKRYASTSTFSDLSGISGFTTADQNGNQSQTIPLSSLVASGDTVTGFSYQQNAANGNVFYGVWILIERPGAGALIVDSWTENQNDSGSYYGAALQAMDGLELPA